jgi:hypothetical protein
MQEPNSPNVHTVQVPAESGHRALQHAREEVDAGCQLLMTSDTGMVALVLPDRLLDQPETPELNLRLAAIARHYSLQGQVTEAGKMLATAARRTIGGSLAARTTRRTEPAMASRPRRARVIGVSGLRTAQR